MLFARTDVDGITPVGKHAHGRFANEDSASSLVAWDPVHQREAWRVKTPIHFNGGVLATGGRLVFQGQMDDKFNAYDASNGHRLWSFENTLK